MGHATFAPAASAAADRRLDARAGTVCRQAVARKLILCALALAAAAPAPPPALTLAVPPGQLHEKLRRLVGDAYAAATQTKLADALWDGDSLDVLKATPPDLAVVNGAGLLTGCKSGQFRKLDWGKLGRDRYLAPAPSDCGAGLYLAATGLAWDAGKFQAPPQWADFWDVTRYPGRRGLQRTARGTLEIALLADGVAPGDVYRTLGSPDGLNRAFRKLDQLKSFIQWWDQPAQPAQWLAAGKVLLTSAPAEGLNAGPKKKLVLQWNGSLVTVASLVVPQAAPHADAAAIALTLANDPARQAEFAEATGLGPAATQAVDLLSPEVRATSPSAPENLKGALVVDEGFWAANGAKLEQRFADWLGKG